ncbi:hypothetical protein P8S55_15230 [Halomonas sp. M1]|uniref:TonB-dependent receptor n=1 Tax=Halomonas sp. M1 TaxID=3035470 RepID=UPI0024857979|nr:TonB-dependent receptor [Halomonas sp. M1]WFE71121.1 hypothetical protein P8S55_15230 [Halomonas sp. M1]
MSKRGLKSVLAGLTTAALFIPPIAVAEGSRDTGLEIDVSLILEGFFYNEISSGNQTLAGFSGHDHGHDHGHSHSHDHGLSEGFNLGHSELIIESRLGDLLDGTLLVGFDEDHIEVEEAYLVTRALPAGFQLKGGKFLSDVGYMNSRHPHDWNFSDRPLVNRFLFGDHGLQETGIQASWVAPTRTFTRFGIEVLQGENGHFNRFVAVASGHGDHGHGHDDHGHGHDDHGHGHDDHGHGHDDHGHGHSHGGAPYSEHSAPTLFTAFVKTGPDLGADHALQLGASTGYNRQVARVEDHGHHAHALEGDAWFAGLDLAYRYDAGRSYGQGDWRVTSEYFHVWRNLDEYVEHGNWEQRDRHRERQDGMYLEAVYGVAPRWQAGLRTEALGLTNKVVDFHPTEVESLSTSYRHSAQVTFRPVEQVFLRTQLSHNDFAANNGERDRGLELMFQVNVALGAHGAHRF